MTFQPQQFNVGMRATPVWLGTGSGNRKSVLVANTSLTEALFLGSDSSVNAGFPNETTELPPGGNAVFDGSADIWAISQSTTTCQVAPGAISYAPGAMI